jgi:hypothetical protein
MASTDRHLLPGGSAASSRARSASSRSHIGVASGASAGGGGLATGGGGRTTTLGGGGLWCEARMDGREVGGTRMGWGHLLRWALLC